MEIDNDSSGFLLRQATAQDDATIHHIISQVHINPMGLDWRHFILAVDQGGTIIGCGQLKPHYDGSLELASIAVIPGEWRGRGVARAIIEHLLHQHPGRLYLTCRSELGPLYQKFGFEAIELDEMTPYFKRLSRLVNLLNSLARQPGRLLVMRRQ
jgi:N-acetylglutamate synthase-like GNAT family acetyltransferase